MRPMIRFAPCLAIAALGALLGCSSSSTESSATSTASTTSSGTATGAGGMGMGGMGQGGWGQGGTGMGGAAAATCDGYCAHVMGNCTGALQQFPDEASCKAFCATWDAGDPGKHAGDTVACHDYHADAPAQGSPDPHCYHGGPSGDGPCGASTCDDFCAAAVKLCTGDQKAWADEASCLTDCEGFGSNGQGFSTNATTGDTVECRLYHLTVAATDPATHCAHIGKDSAVCK